jgi:hypothetical protein
VKIFTIAYHRRPNEAQQGASDFVYWHWTQLLFKNPAVQLIRHDNISIAPFAIAYLGFFEFNEYLKLYFRRWP